jgi:hypothetical protein
MVRREQEPVPRPHRLPDEDVRTAAERAQHAGGVLGVPAMPVRRRIGGLVRPAPTARVVRDELDLAPELVDERQERAAVGGDPVQPEHQRRTGGRRRPGLHVQRDAVVGRDRALG